MKDGSVRGVRWLRMSAQPITFLLIMAAVTFFVRHGSFKRGGALSASRPSQAAYKPQAGAPGAPGSSGRAHWNDVYALLPLSFEANRGQTDGRVKFVSRGHDYALFLTSNEAVFELENPKWKVENRIRKPEDQNSSASVLRMQLAGASRHASVEATDELPGKTNYFLGNIPADWRAGVATYARVRYRGVYPGIDLVYYGNQRRLEYDFVVSPGADPRAIELRLRGANRANIDKQGNLLLESNGREIIFHQPQIYQTGAAGRQSVQGGYVLDRVQPGIRSVRFRIGPYDPSQPLIIDPSLAYSTYLGGSDNDQANGIALDSAGNAYITGQTFSTNFPLQAPEQGTCTPAGSTAVCGTSTGKSDVFVSKINAAGTALVYSTYLGGSSLDFGVAVAVDPAGDAYVTGETDSTDFPTHNPFQTTGDVLGDAFVTEFNPAGSALIYSSYLGGTGTSIGQGIAADSAGNAYVVGTTNATNFPVAGAYQATNQGNSDVFMTKIAAAGTKILYSTYLGGAGNDTGTGIVVGPAGNAYVTGQTDSNNFPTATAYQASYGGQGDAFVTKLILSGASVTLGYSTYLGGTNADQANGIALDRSNNVYVTGITSSTDFPLAGPLQGALPGGTGQHVFVSKLDDTGSKLVYSTYLGGSGIDTARAIAVDSSGVAHVTGYTTSSNFPMANPIQNTYAGNTDAFLVKLNPMGCGLAFSTYLGGKATDEGTSVAANAAGDSFITGVTGSNDFPVMNALQGTTHGNNDAILAKVPAFSAPSTCVSPNSITFPAQEVSTASSAMTVTLTNGGSADLSVTSIAAAGPFAETNTCGASVAAGQNCSISVTFNPTTAGSSTGSLTVTDNSAGASSATHTVALSGVGTDFGLQIEPGSASISAGQSATFMVTVMPSAQFSQAITMACNTTVLAGTCSISPTSITPSGGTAAPATVTVTSSSGGSTPPADFGDRWPPLAWLATLIGVALFVAAVRMRRMERHKVLASFGLLAMAMLLVMGWFACGVSNSRPSHTPPGSYVVNVSGTAGSLAHSVRAQISVQ